MRRNACFFCLDSHLFAHTISVPSPLCDLSIKVNRDTLNDVHDFINYQSCLPEASDHSSPKLTLIYCSFSIIKSILNLLYFQRKLHRDGPPSVGEKEQHCLEVFSYLSIHGY